MNRALKIILSVIILIIVIIAAALPYYILARIMKFNAMYVTERVPYINISDLYDTLKTGDIILFACTVNMPSNSALSHVYHSHSALVVQDGEDPQLGPLFYTSESQPGAKIMPIDGIPREADPLLHVPEITMNEGCDLAPLLVRIKYYCGNSYIMRLSRPLTPAATTAIKSRINELINTKWPYPTTAQLFREMIFGAKKDSPHHCFQHVEHLLRVGGLLDADQQKSTLGACHLLSKLSEYKLNDGYFYYPPLQIAYDL